MPTREQLLRTAAAGAVAGLAGSGVRPQLGLSAQDKPVATPTRFTSQRAPYVSLTVPSGWYVRPDLADGMSVPWSLAFLSNEHIPQRLPQSGDWNDIVDSALSPTGSAVALMAFDQLVPASSWLRGNAPEVLAGKGIGLGPLGPVGRLLPAGIRLADLARSDQLANGMSVIGWFDVGHYVTGVQVWLGPRAEAEVLDSVLATVRGPGS
jgi:hypothetical protein